MYCYFHSTVLLQIVFVVYFVRHADGKVCFWDMNRSAATNLLYCMNTASIFGTGADQQDMTSAPADEDWPPFRKVSCSVRLSSFIIEIFFNVP